MLGCFVSGAFKSLNSILFEKVGFLVKISSTYCFNSRSGLSIYIDLHPDGDAIVLIRDNNGPITGTLEPTLHLTLSLKILAANDAQFIPLPIAFPIERALRL